MKNNAVNWPVVLAVTALCAVSMTLFFIQNHSSHNSAHNPVAPTADTEPSSSQDWLLSDLDYYNQVADEYIDDLPSDKTLIARLVDSTMHHIVYFETTNHPSCYIFDLESLTTDVLFGGEEGFYCDTKLLIVGTIHQWMRLNDLVYFIADNRAPETSLPNAVLVFALNLRNRQLSFIDNGSEAEFRQPDRLRISHATLLYHSLFTGEDVYDQTTVTVQLPEE